MIPHKVKPFPWIAEGSPLFALSQTCAFILSANWVMQGMRGMDRGELCFRFALFGGLFALLASLGLPPFWAAVGAHSFNFAANGHPWVCMRYCAFYRQSPETIEAWLQDWSAKLQRLNWLQEAVIIGSRAKRLASSRSDIDLRLIVSPGWLGWFRTNLVLLRMRTDALIHRIPLDLYAYDCPLSLRRFDQHEPMAIVLDRQNRVRLLFQHRQIVEP